MDFTHYYGRHKRKNNIVLQNNVVQTKTKKYQFRADIELIRDIEKFKKEMNQNTSKVITDILNDFFLLKIYANKKKMLNTL